MTFEQKGSTPENSDKKEFNEITRRMAGNYALQDGELEYRIADDEQDNQVDLPDTPFSAPEEVVRGEKTYVRRNLDEEGLTPKEDELALKVALRDEKVDIRVRETLAGAPVTNLPKSIQTEKGVTKAEKDAIREDVSALVRARAADPVLQTEKARRRTAAMVSEEYEIPEYAIDESDDIDYSRIPSTLHHTSLRPDGFPVAKDL